MDLLTLIDSLTEKIESASSIPLSGKSLIDKDEIIEIIENIRLNLPDELKQAKWIKEERQRILDEANKEAEAKLEQAKSQIISMMSETEIAKQARELASDIENKANANASEIKMGILKYSDQILDGIGGTVDDARQVLEKTIADINSSIEIMNRTLSVIDENRKELRK